MVRPSNHAARAVPRAGCAEAEAGARSGPAARRGTAGRAWRQAAPDLRGAAARPVPPPP
ncbi:hypothetical protein GCM10010106_45360 [Thermopolyspora flexuosa]|nr:hypothetical protein GCM10010106_45360 [Thermopolyspora flexuosa]